MQPANILFLGLSLVSSVKAGIAQAQAETFDIRIVFINDESPEKHITVPADKCENVDFEEIASLFVDTGNAKESAFCTLYSTPDCSGGNQEVVESGSWANFLGELKSIQCWVI
ncbi:hypothetical protein N7461_003629 [Penicillium sp. DV-2018c]|nr:hypothetical protein N7461_003629 [Penicillium sp. DV-2018c]